MPNLGDLTGKKFGMLTFIKDAPVRVLPSGQKPRRAICKCDCGNITDVLLLHLVRGRIFSCGCKRRSAERVSEIGNKYGSLTVIRDLDDIKSNGRTFRMVEAVCDCGSVRRYRLSVVKYLKSCGCLTSDILKRSATTHGLENHPLYRHWQNMKNRCYNAKVESYKYYGASGVVVCKKWKHNFMSFYNWAIANGYKSGLSLDRFPNTKGNYEPKNCRWATAIQQANNKSTNVLYSYGGKKMTLAEIARECDMSYKRLHARLSAGWSLGAATNSLINTKNKK